MIRANSPYRRQERPRPAAPQRHIRLRTGAATAALGFICGAVFWHFVGFWDFVSHAVLNGQGTPTDLSEKQLERVRSSPATPGRSGCVSLYRSLDSSETRQGHCPIAHWHPRRGGLAQRGDREPYPEMRDGTGVAGWSWEFDMPQYTAETQ